MANNPSKQIDTISSGWLLATVRAMLDYGIPEQELLLGLPANALSPNHSAPAITLLEARLLWHRAAALAGDPLLGLQLRITSDARALGPVAPLIWHSESLDELVSNIARYHRLISDNGRFEVAYDGDLIWLDYTPVPGSIPSHPQHILSVINAVVLTLAQIERRAFQPATVHLPAELDLDSVIRNTGWPATSGAAPYRLGYQRAGSVGHYPGTHRDYYLLNKHYVEQLLAVKDQRAHFQDAIGNYIKARGFASATLAGFAAEQGISERKVQRLLTSQNTSFRQLREQLLKDVAFVKINQSDLSISALAEELGFSETSALVRAFTKWFGVSPTQYRKK